MEFIVQLFRALANTERIKVLRTLQVLGEMSVSHIAQATGVELSRMSTHLKVLSAAGLLWRRRSGRVVEYYIAERAFHPVAACVLKVTKGVFSQVGQMKPDRVAQADQAKSPTSSDAALFACFTAFTHPRRLQIIRHLAKHGTASLLELRSVLSMSQPACLRHLAKLERRGFLTRRSAGPRTTYALAEGSGQLQAELLSAVRGYLLADETDLTPAQV